MNSKQNFIPAIASYSATGDGKTISYLVSRSRTGIYHRSWGDKNPSQNMCNARNGGFGASFADARHVAAAKPEMFCKKCFSPEGREKVQVKAVISVEANK